MRTVYPNTDKLFADVSNRLEYITRQPNNLPQFIENGCCSFHNKDDSGKRLYEWTEFIDFLSFIKQNMREYLTSVSVMESDVRIAGMWANRYPPDTFVGIHNHRYLNDDKKIIIDMLYYIKREDNAGDLVIDIPEYGEYNVFMQQGDVIIFQSTLDHWTTSNKSASDKYVIGLELVDAVEGKRLDEI